MKIINIDEENLYIFFISSEISRKDVTYNYIES